VNWDYSERARSGKRRTWQISIYVVDAFASRVFTGNPAAVCLLDRWLEDELLQAIAAENNLSETAFLVRSESDWDLRWFTPACEVDLCGHATLASAFVLFRHIESSRSELRFSTRSGVLTVTREDDLLAMTFPRRDPVPRPAPPEIVQAMGARPSESYFSRDYFLIYASEEEIRALQPKLDRVAEAAEHGVVVTAKGDEVDYVLRFFAPSVGVPEDPVTGSVQCTLCPLWAARLGKKRLVSRQLSKRGGELYTEESRDAVRILGRAVQYSEGTIEITP
jgi:predicted PhzF superfamily epimerase YddE/YHI9